MRNEAGTAMAGRMLVLVALGELLGMTVWFSATAAAPSIAQEFALDPAAASVADDGGSGGVRGRHADHGDY